MQTKQPGSGRRRAGLVAGGVGLLLAGGGTIAWAASQQVGPPPAPPAATSTTKGETPSASPSTSGGGSGATASESSSSTASPTPSVAEALPAAKPVAVRLPSIDVKSPVHPLGLNAQGGLEVPSGDRYDDVAWYDGSPTPGEVGPAVLEGHVTGSSHNPSVFFELGDTRQGDRIEVDRADGSTATFEVTQVKEYPKADFPQVDVYGATQGPELRVITCGGTYDENARRHQDNIVVFAELVQD
ncbi:class F sortase [Janibacter alittae]|uniref:Class F sortase n=1 Tax=Janibacter alittae TaxID=3115209 RepID=A0ABZ2MHE8_9MICO